MHNYSYLDNIVDKRTFKGPVQFQVVIVEDILWGQNMPFYLNFLVRGVWGYFWLHCYLVGKQGSPIQLFQSEEGGKGEAPRSDFEAQKYRLYAPPPSLLIHPCKYKKYAVIHFITMRILRHTTVHREASSLANRFTVSQ